MTIAYFNGDEFVMIRSASAEAFHCARCNQPKKAKAKAVAPSGAVICNGCYGNLLAK